MARGLDKPEEHAPAFYIQDVPKSLENTFPKEYTQDGRILFLLYFFPIRWQPADILDIILIMDMFLNMAILIGCCVIFGNDPSRGGMVFAIFMFLISIVTNIACNYMKCYWRTNFKSNDGLRRSWHVWFYSRYIQWSLIFAFFTISLVYIALEVRKLSRDSNRHQRDNPLFQDEFDQRRSRILAKDA